MIKTELKTSRVIAIQEVQRPDKPFSIAHALHEQKGNDQENFVKASVVVAHKNIVHIVCGVAENPAEAYLKAYQDALGDDIPEVKTVFEARHVLETEETPEHVILKNEEQEVIVFPHREQLVMNGFGLDRNGVLESTRDIYKTPVGLAVGAGLQRISTKNLLDEKTY